jgi:hypothetical protein
MIEHVFGNHEMIDINHSGAIIDVKMKDLSSQKSDIGDVFTLKTKNNDEKMRKGSDISANSLSTTNSAEHSCSEGKLSETGFYTKVMHERWLKSIVIIPDIDQKDIYDENPRINDG